MVTVDIVVILIVIIIIIIVIIIKCWRLSFIICFIFTFPFLKNSVNFPILPFYGQQAMWLSEVIILCQFHAFLSDIWDFFFFSLFYFIFEGWSFWELNLSVDRKVYTAAHASILLTYTK